MTTQSTQTDAAPADAAASIPDAILATGTAINEKHAKNIARETLKASPELRALYGENEFRWRAEVEPSKVGYLVRFFRVYSDSEHLLEVSVRKHKEGQFLSPASLAAMPTYPDGSGTHEQTLGFVMQHLAEDEERCRAIRRFVQANYEILAGLNFSACRWTSREKWKEKAQIEISWSQYRGEKTSPGAIADFWPELTWTRMIEDYPSADEINFHWVAELEDIWIVIKAAEKQILKPHKPKDGDIVRRPLAERESEAAA